MNVYPQEENGKHNIAHNIINIALKTNKFKTNKAEMDVLTWKTVCDYQVIRTICKTSDIA